MVISVQTAALATIPYSRKEPKDVWASLIKMFPLVDSNDYGEIAYIPGGHRIIKVVHKVNNTDVAGVGDTFKSATTQGSALFITITHWEPEVGFSYLEHSSRQDTNGYEKMDFRLHERAHSTSLEIIRREKWDGAFNSWTKKLSGSYKHYAAGRLEYILTSNSFGKNYKNGQAKSFKPTERAPEGFTVERNDALRQMF